MEDEGVADDHDENWDPGVGGHQKKLPEAACLSLTLESGTTEVELPLEVLPNNSVGSLIDGILKEEWLQ